MFELIDTLTTLSHGSFDSLSEAIGAAHFDHISNNFEILDSKGNSIYGFDRFHAYAD